MRFCRLVNWITSIFFWVTEALLIFASVVLTVGLLGLEFTDYGSGPVSGWGTIASAFAFGLGWAVGLIAIAVLSVAMVYVGAPAVVAIIYHVRYKRDGNPESIRISLLVKSIFLSIIAACSLPTLGSVRELSAACLPTLALCLLTVLGWIAFVIVRRHVKKK